MRFYTYGKDPTPKDWHQAAEIIKKNQEKVKNSPLKSGK